ncbi:TonB-dependent receptor plug domain-containing protein [Bergeyella porcorum]|uniref:TonB-dependent receptor plug domain-containing protein n=1 Tax=Bergeyella porcorum TaxID=1735111 RepID=UPI0035E69E07
MDKKNVKLAVLFFIGAAATLQAQKTDKDSIKVKNVEEVVILGTRGKPRTNTESPVPIDVFNIKEQSVVLPQTNVAQILNAVAPSFTSTVQTNADGTDHLDPAQLRALGPDQVLVLVNGKRRHTSSLVNVNGTTGRGSVGTDLNAIPSFAINNIEVLRDGAAAQYGSDAIAGVINLGLKRDTGKLTGQLTYGGHLTPAANDHQGDFDGENIQVDLNYGNKIGNRGGFFNITWTSQFRDRTSRAGTESGTLFNAYNAIEKRALDSGVNLSQYFSNINSLTTSQSDALIGAIQQYAGSVGYFSSDYLNQILGANSITSLQTLLKTDVTDQELAARGLTRKDFNMQVGQSKLSNHQLFANVEVPLNDNWKVYSFGGYSLRQGDAGGFYRRPNQARTFTGYYINGFMPQISTTIEDVSLAAGIKGNWKGWNVDLSNTFGQNTFDYDITNTSNTSLRFASPTEFDAGGLRFRQNTLNLDFSKPFDWLKGANVAFGAEHRYENFAIRAGEAASYLQYDVNGLPRTVATLASELPTDFFGNALPGGAQVFSGFRAENAVDKNRQSVAAYADVEVNFTDWLLADAAVRYENYSDFGSTFNYKLASRIKLDKNLNLRVAGSTGFRAPSIQQIYYNTTSTLFTNGVLQEVGTFSNDSNIVRNLLKVPQLKQETSKSVSAGLSYRIPSANLTFTADAYFIRIDDRIVLTDQFRYASASAEAQAAFDAAGVNAAQFFVNSIDTETRGIDFVASHKARLGSVRLENNLAFNLNKTQKVGAVKTAGLLNDEALQSVYFSERARVFLEEAVPRAKASLSHNLNWKGIGFYLRNTYFGKVTSPDVVDANGDGVTGWNEHQQIDAKVITDLSANYQFNKNVGLTLGVNNVFDVYPTKNLPINSNNDQFVYSRSTSQFGQNGRYVFARLSFSF